jgi:hypothetical protein
MIEPKLSRRDGLKGMAALSVGAAVATVATGFTDTAALASGQPHMDQALADLQAALHQLNVALHDKGGHRVKAIALVKEAISETTKGIAAGAA